MNKRSMIFLAVILVVFLAVALYFVPKITPVQLTLDAVKVDGDGNELGTAQILISGSKLDYLFKPSRIDVYIHPFDNYTAIGPTTYVTRFEEIPGMIENYPGREFLYARYSGFSDRSGYLSSFRLAFSPDLTCWAFCDHQNSVFYVASVGNECTTAELVDYFAGLIH